MVYFKKSINENMLIISSYYTKEEKDKIREKAYKENRSISNYIRNAVIREIGDE